MYVCLFAFVCLSVLLFGCAFVCVSLSLCLCVWVCVRENVRDLDLARVCVQVCVFAWL